MKKKIMEKWVSALRSGEYKQIDSRLRSMEPDANGQYSYCCLGVLCDLHRREVGGDEAWGFGLGKAANETTTYAGHSDTLPEPVRQWAGIRSCCPELLADPDGHGQYMVDLTELNDEHGFEFPELAEFIEDQWEDL